MGSSPIASYFIVSRSDSLLHSAASLKLRLRYQCCHITKTGSACQWDGPCSTLSIHVPRTTMSPTFPCTSRAIKALGYAALSLPSGAGHDAVVMSTLAPVAMLFVRCKGGVSHNPAEAVAV